VGLVTGGVPGARRAPGDVHRQGRRRIPEPEKGRVSIYEPGPEELVTETRALAWDGCGSRRTVRGRGRADVLFVAVDTPQGD
jgi:hypothetical protein